MAKEKRKREREERRGEAGVRAKDGDACRVDGRLIPFFSVSFSCRFRPIAASFTRNAPYERGEGREERGWGWDEDEGGRGRGRERDSPETKSAAKRLLLMCLFRVLDRVYAKQMRCDAKSDESDGLALCVRVRVRVLYSAAVPVESRFQSRGGGCGRSGSSTTSNAMRASDAGMQKVLFRR